MKSAEEYYNIPMTLHEKHNIFDLQIKMRSNDA
jgi:hypothetical protein